MLSHSNTASQHLTQYGRILLRMRDSSCKTIIEKVWPRTSTQELQTSILPLLPLKAIRKMYVEATNATLQKIQSTTGFLISILKKLFNRDQPHKDG